MDYWWPVTRVAIVFIVLAAARADATDVTVVVGTLRTAEAECVYLHDLCVAAREAKWSVRNAMAESRANHQRSRALVTDDAREDASAAVRRQDRAVQEHLSAASQHRADAAAAFYEAKRLITVRRGREPVCGACPGI